MGNIIGSVDALTPPPPIAPIPEPSPVKDVPSKSSDDNKNKLGTLEELHKKCKGNRPSIACLFVVIFFVYPARCIPDAFSWHQARLQSSPQQSLSD